MLLRLVASSLVRGSINGGLGASKASRRIGGGENLVRAHFSKAAQSSNQTEPLAANRATMGATNLIAGIVLITVSSVVTGMFLEGRKEFNEDKDYLRFWMRKV